MTDYFIKRTIQPGTKTYEKISQLLQYYKPHPLREGTIYKSSADIPHPEWGSDGKFIMERPGLETSLEGLAYNPRYSADENYFDFSIMINLDSTTERYAKICSSAQSFRCRTFEPYQAKIEILQKEKDGGWKLLDTLTTTSGQAWQQGSLYVFDLDGDGDRDILLRPGKNSPITLFANSAIAATQEVREAPISSVGHNAVFPLSHSRGRGTATLVKFTNRHAYLVTNHHVVKSQMRTFMVKPFSPLHSSPLVNVEVIATDPVNDLALVRVEKEAILNKAAGLSCQVFSCSTPIELTTNLGLLEEVEIYGYPSGILIGGWLTQTHIKGRVGVELLTGLLGMFVVDIRGEEGSSGGPVLNRQGELVGLVQGGGGDNSANETACVGPSRLAQFLRKHLPK